MTTFSTFTPSFLLHKANATLDRDETFGLARLLAAVDKRDVRAEQIRPSFLLARNVLRHVVALEATGEATAASFRDAENAGDVANTSRPARFPFEPPEASPRDDPRRDDDPDVCREGADAPPPSDVPAMDPRPRAPADDAAARARHLASANATLAADLAAARANLALLRESAAAPTPPRPPPSFAVASAAADRIAAVDDERRALRAALDASRAECVALRRQLDTDRAARRGDSARTIPRNATPPPSPPSREIAPSPISPPPPRRTPRPAVRSRRSARGASPRRWRRARRWRRV